jgi:hypothetical protein
MKLKQLYNEVKLIKYYTYQGLFDYCTTNKQKIADLNPYYTRIIMDNDINILKNLNWMWSEDEFDSPYPDYSWNDFVKDFNKYEGSIAMLGEELATVFVTFNPTLPQRYAATVTSNDLLFFGNIPNKKNPFKKHNIDGKDIYIVWGIPDPGS